MLWKITYEILDNADLYNDMLNWKEEKGEFTEKTVKEFCLFTPFYTWINLNDPDIDWQYVADSLNKEEH